MTRYQREYPRFSEVGWCVMVGGVYLVRDGKRRVWSSYAAAQEVALQKSGLHQTVASVFPIPSDVKS